MRNLWNQPILWPIGVLLLALAAGLAAGRTRLSAQSARRAECKEGKMIGYVLRRLLYAIPILIGVNVFIFTLFFAVNTPDNMARIHLGMKRVTPDAVAKWKHEHGYDKPLLFNAQATGAQKFTETIFFSKSVPMFAFKFGAADDGRDIGQDIKTRMLPSLALAAPVFLLGLLLYITFRADTGFFSRHLCGLCRRGAMRGHDVDLRIVLHHRRPVSHQQAIALGADFGIPVRYGCV